jgi:PhnB protein
MSTQSETRIVQSYLVFNGRCEEAVAFYRKAIGAEVEVMMRFKDSPEPHPSDRLPPGFENKIMHTSFRVGRTTLMASDGCSAGKTSFEGFSLCLTVNSETEADQVFAALSDGGKATMPLARTFWSPRFGMVKDRFGLNWMIIVPHANPN